MTTQQRKAQFHFQLPSAWNSASGLASKVQGCRRACIAISPFPGGRTVDQEMILRGKRSVSYGNSPTSLFTDLKIFRVANHYDMPWPIAWRLVVSLATTAILTVLKRTGNWEMSGAFWKSFAR